jgi:hypothetical protein
MDSKDLIDKILKSFKIEDILEFKNYSSEVKSVLKQIHPDVCKLPNAEEAFKKFFTWRTIYEDGKSFIDESGSYTTNYHWVKFLGTSDLLKKSLENYNKIKSLGNTNLNKYLPKDMVLNGNVLEVNLLSRAIPLSGINLSQGHTNWVLSRMLEFSVMLNTWGYIHCGINPESIFICPETHGIQVVSFYHLAKIDSTVSTICAKYKNWYPPELFTNKTAVPSIDLELSKKSAIYLLGDSSGSGVKLRKTFNHDFMEFVIAKGYDPVKTYDKYRELLAKNFEKIFLQLDI